MYQLVFPYTPDPTIPVGEMFATRVYRPHYSDVIMGTIASQISSLTIVYSIVYSYADQRKHQSSASLAFMRGIYRGLVNSPHKWPVTWKMFPFDDVIMGYRPHSISPGARFWSPNGLRNQMQPAGHVVVVKPSVFWTLCFRKEWSHKSYFS